MWAFARALLILARHVRRAALALEDLAKLYRLDLDSRGILPAPHPELNDPVEVMYPTSKSPLDLGEL